MYLVVRRTFLRNYDTGEEIVLEKTSYGDGFGTFEDAVDCMNTVLANLISTLLGASFERNEGSGRYQIDIECDEETENRSVQVLNYDISPGCVYGTELLLCAVE